MGSRIAIRSAFTCKGDIKNQKKRINMPCLKSLSRGDGNLFLKAIFLTSKNKIESVMLASAILPAKAMRNCLIIFAFGDLLLIIFFAAFSH